MAIFLSCVSIAGFTDVQIAVTVVEAIRGKEPTLISITNQVETALVPTQEPIGDATLELQTQYASEIIKITNVRLEPDVATGRRQVRVHIDSNIPIRFYRAAQVTLANQAAPLAGVKWRILGGSDNKVVELFGCGVDGYRPDLETVAVQVRGDPLPNPNLVSYPLINDSVVSKTVIDLPEAVLPRITRMYRNPPSSRPEEPTSIPDTGGKCVSDNCLIWPGSPTHSFAKAMQIHVENFPGTEPVALSTSGFDCVNFVHVHNQVMGPDHTMRADVDFVVGKPSCENSTINPKIFVSSCGKSQSGPARPFPIRFEPIKYVQEDTDVFGNGSHSQSGIRVEGLSEYCKVEMIDGDFSLTSTQGNCTFTLKRGSLPRWNRYKLHFETQGGGNCRLEKTFNILDTPLLNFDPRLGLFNRRSSYHPYYDDYSHQSLVHRVEPSNIEEPLFLENRQPIQVFHTCTGYSGSGGNARTWIKMVEVVQYGQSTVLNVK